MMLQDEIAISVQELKKSYRNVTVFEGADFEVKNRQSVRAKHHQKLLLC